MASFVYDGVHVILTSPLADMRTRHMNHLNRLSLITLLVLFVSGIAVGADDDDVMGDGMWKGPKFIGKEWKEASVRVPPLPKDANLLPFKVYNSRFRHLIDSQSLNVSGGDNIARYTVVVISPAGIRNTFYEGIRCDTQKFKTYAYSVEGGPFSVIASPEWKDIVHTGNGSFRYDLYHNYLCKSSIIRDKKKYIIQLLKSSPDHYDYDDVD